MNFLENALTAERILTLALNSFVILSMGWILARLLRHKAAPLRSGITLMVITILIGWHGFELSMLFWDSGKLIDTIFVPKWIPQLVVPLGALALFLVLLVQLIEYIFKSGKRD